MKYSMMTMILAFCLVFFAPYSWGNDSDLTKKCGEIFHNSRVMTPVVVKELNKILKSSSFNGGQVMDFLSKDPELEKLFAADAGVWEGYSIREHTQMVYDTFEEQVSFFEIDQLKVSESLSAIQLLRFVIAVHDIGKPIAISREGKEAQHKYTYNGLKELAKSSSMSLKDYFKLQSFFYIIDASSYPDLRKRIFHEEKGKLVLNSSEFHTLVAQIFN